MLRIPLPGMLHGSYPERRQSRASWRGRLAQTVKSLTARLNAGWPVSPGDFLQQVATHEFALSPLSQAGIEQRSRALRGLLARQGMDTALVTEAFALIRIVCGRELNIRPDDQEVLAARILLDGKLAAMPAGKTGTLAIAICSACAALAGIPVHVVSANDRHVTHDTAAMISLYSALGLTVGAVTAVLEPENRRRQYGCDITYVSARELMLDYLYDVNARPRSDLHGRIDRLGEKPSLTMLRGLCMAIITDAASILRDQATLPVASNPIADFYQPARELAAGLATPEDFVVDRRRMSVELTSSGRLKLDQNTRLRQAPGQPKIFREQTLCQALAAEHLYQRDRHYRAAIDRIRLIDGKGEAVPEKAWSRGLLHLLALKEGCQAQAEENNANSLSSRDFFSAYFHLAGIGHQQFQAEMLSSYGLRTEAVEDRHG